MWKTSAPTPTPTHTPGQVVLMSVLLLTDVSQRITAVWV